MICTDHVFESPLIKKTIPMYSRKIEKYQKHVTDTVGILVIIYDS